MLAVAAPIALYVNYCRSNRDSKGRFVKRAKKEEIKQEQARVIPVNYLGKQIGTIIL